MRETSAEKDRRKMTHTETHDTAANIAGWQSHSVRGYLSSAAKKHNLRIESTKNEAGDRVYHTQG
jgi:Protein of unknown function (DUF3489)